MKSKTARQLASHGIALAVGAAVAAFSLPGQRAPVDANGGRPAAADRTSSHPAASGSELLDAVARAVPPSRAEQNDRMNLHELASSRFDELRTDLPATADPAGTFYELLESMEKSGELAGGELLTPEQAEALALLGVRYAQWFEADPLAALEAVAGSTSPNVQLTNAMYVDRITKGLLERQGLRHAMEWLPKVNPSWIGYQHVARDIGSRGEMDDWRWLMSEHADLANDRYFEAATDSLGHHWPLESRDELVRELEGPMKVRALYGLASRMEGTAGVEWLRSWIDSGDLSRQEIAEIADSHMATRLAAQAGGSLEEQLEILRELGVGGGQVDHSRMVRMLGGAVEQSLTASTSGNAWLHAFRHGHIPADEVYENVLAVVPDPGPEELEFRSHVFRHLAEEDVDRAGALLEDMPKQEADLHKAYAARWAFFNVDPERYYDLVSSIPTDGNPELTEHLREAWKGESAGNLERFGDAYAEWVLALPAGPHRKWALEGLGEASRTQFPSIHSQIAQALEDEP